ncbi:hypothetical protein F5Y07DRAFT_178231 [Xylaria sp. FL0933]|nr:hypothetical protein F5Y07DRAFT_178231 [Xylaria sp. FL0933]
MASLSTLNSADGGHRRSFTPTATEFTPKSIETKREVLRASFVSQVIPNAHKYAAIIGLCTVPQEKAGMDDLGWHIADFLAFRALLCGDNHPKSQTWLAMCDIPALAEDNPKRYVHGKDRRMVGSAARSGKYQTPTGLTEREDNIQVETSAAALKDKFTQALKKKLEVVKKHKYPLLLIICGLTSLEQDIYFGSLKTDHRYTMKELRYDIGDDIDHIDATIVTPALFSAGWQINTSFGRPNCIELRGNRVEFLARQLGGLFAQDLVQIFCGWNCPALDEAKVDPDIRARERYPGPVPPSDKVKGLTSQLRVKIHSCLVGELSTCHLDHSFSFAKSKDEWEVLIEPREKSSGYQPLESYERKWNELPSAQGLPPTDECFAFLGIAFGGNRASQLKHVKYLIEESYLAWPDHWASNFGRETKKDFERFIATDHPDDLDCHEIFNALEHRARTSILGDTIVQYFDLPMPLNQRCRDFNNLEWKQQLSQTDRHSLIKHFGTVFASVPGPNVPPGVNPNNLSRLQRRLESGAGYVRASLMIRLLTSKDASEIVTNRIESCK